MNDLRIKLIFGIDSLSIHPLNWYLKPEQDQSINGEKVYNFLCFELIVGHRYKNRD